MSERINHSPEHQTHTPEHHVETPELSREQARHEHQEQIHKIRGKAHKHAKAAHEVRPDEPSGHDTPHHYVTSELKDMAYQRAITRVRRQLSPGARSFSKVIHQPAVDALSEATAKTIGRPSGILGGGILAFVGTTAYYYIARHYGYEYNFGIFLLLLAAGFAIGWIAEFFLRTMHGRR